MDSGIAIALAGTITKYCSKRKGKKGKVTWGYRFRAGKDSTGKWKWITKKGFQREREAKEACTAAIAALGKCAQPLEEWTFSALCDRYIDEHCRQHCESTTVQGYIAKSQYARRCFGGVAARDLTPLRIESALNGLRQHGGKVTATAPNGKPLSAKTIREIAAVINGTFNAAIRWGLVEANPMRRVTLPRLHREEPRIVVRTELHVWLRACREHDWLHMLTLLALATGCRRGELLGLTWPDIDFSGRTLTISKSLAQTKERGVYLKLPKGRRTRRFSLPDSCLKALETYRSYQHVAAMEFGSGYRLDLALVFAQPDGNYLRPDSVTAKVCSFVKRLGLPKGTSLHKLRHTHGSYLLSLGIALPAVSKRLGHANTNVTATVYAHAIEKDDHSAARIWDESMGDLF